jgi:hypothetical protein
MKAERKVLTATETAQFFSLSLKMRRRPAHNGVISAKNAGRRWVFSQAE